MAVRVLPQLRRQLKKDIDNYPTLDVLDFDNFEDDELRMKSRIPDIVELERLFEIAKIAFEQKMVVLFGVEELV
jgi:hypothetical protein